MKKQLFILLLMTLSMGCGRLNSATPTATQAPTATPLILIATPTPLGEDILEPIDVEEQLITNLYERVGPSVVHITARVVTMNFFFGPTASEGTGSGFIYDEAGHIVTNYHVIEGADSLEVKLSDGTTTHPGRPTITCPLLHLALSLILNLTTR